MKFIIAGLPTPKTSRTVSIVEEALALLTCRARVERIFDAGRMKTLGIRKTPTILLNARVMAEGRIPSIYEVESWIEAEEH